PSPCPLPSGEGVLRLIRGSVGAICYQLSPVERGKLFIDFKTDTIKSALSCRAGAFTKIK
ncbi:MAG TPA: hypothetical protein PLT22_09470, partial [Flexilinea sp.]|nr:hypothetical protein [Flexilinea sp.]